MRDPQKVTFNHFNTQKEFDAISKNSLVGCISFIKETRALYLGKDRYGVNTYTIPEIDAYREEKGKVISKALVDQKRNIIELQEDIRWGGEGIK